MQSVGDPVVYKPNVGETLKKYLLRYTVEETIKIFEDPDKLNEFCTVLLTTRWSEQKLINGGDPAYQKLWGILEQTDNYNVFLHHIKMWEPSRKDLLENMSEFASELNAISKWCTIARIIGCSTESLSTIMGLQLTGSKADSFLNIATLFGGVGLFITLAEMKISKDKFHKLMKLIERDQTLFVPIQKWYQQCKEVENAMTNVFPFDYTSQIVEEFSDIFAGKKVFDRVSLLTSLLTGLLKEKTEKGEHKKKEKEVLENNLNKKLEEVDENLENLEENRDDENITISQEEDKEMDENPEKLEENKGEEKYVESFVEDKERIYKIISKLVDFISHPGSKEICEWIFLEETHPALLNIAKMVLQYYYSPLRFIICQSVRALSPVNQNLYSIPIMGRLAINGWSLLGDISRLRNFEVPGIYEMRKVERHLRCEMEALNKIVKTLSKSDS